MNLIEVIAIIIAAIGLYLQLKQERRELEKDKKPKD
jgi:hypothetical protein